MSRRCKIGTDTCDFECNPDNTVGGGNNSERVKFLFERCLVPCAEYEEFWLRYIKYLISEEDNVGAAREYFERAINVFVPHDRILLRLSYALFEEQYSTDDRCKEIYQKLLVEHPTSVQVINQYAHYLRRRGKVNDAEEVYRKGLDTESANDLEKSFIAVQLSKVSMEGRLYVVN